MFFTRYLQNDKQEQCREVLEKCAAIINDSANCLWQSVQAVGRQAEQPEAPIMALVRHVVEMLDATSVLVAKGCVSACDPLMRSALEATFSLYFILEKDTKNRAFAYLVAFIHKRIRYQQRLQVAHQSNKQLRQDLIGDALCTDMLDRLQPHDREGTIAALE